MASWFGATIIPFGLVGEDDICDASATSKDMLSYYVIPLIIWCLETMFFTSNVVRLQWSYLAPVSWYPWQQAK